MCSYFCAIIFLLITVVYNVNAEGWLPLKDDGLHDPDNPALQWLQNPGDALSRLPADSAGNRVDWIRAFQDGYIQPRNTLSGVNKKVEKYDAVILLNNTGSLPGVLFPHKPHTEWLDCSNCHESIFSYEPGKTPISMTEILDGKYCGVCHGAVSFPLTECNRCHSAPARMKLGVQQSDRASE